MQCSGTFDGQFLVDEQAEAELVKVFISDAQAVFTAETGSVMLRRKKLHLRPFDKFVMFTQDARALGTESWLELSGSGIGALVDGPLGHPGDGENAFSRVEKARVVTIHTADGLQVSIEGLLAAHAAAAAASTFRVQFGIPLQAYQSFFCLSPETQQYVESLYAKHFGAA